MKTFSLSWNLFFDTPAKRFFLVLYLILMASLYPGITTRDSEDMLLNAITLHISDWHAPILTYFWHLWNILFLPGAASLFLVNLSLHFSALYYLSTRALTAAFWHIYLVLFVIFYPPNYSLLGAATKDGFFTSTLLVSLACILAARLAKNKPSYWIFTGFGLFFGLLAINTRPDGIGALSPLVLWLFFPSHFTWLRLVKTTFLTGFALLVLLAGNFLVTDYLTDSRHDHPEQVVMLHDLAALSESTHQLLLPDFALNSDATLERVIAGYHPVNNEPLFVGDLTTVHFVMDPDQFKIYQRIWLTQVLHHPGSYLLHKAKTFCAFLGFGPKVDRGIFWFTTLDKTHNLYFSARPADQQKYHLVVHDTPLTGLEVMIYWPLKRSFFFMPMFCLTLDLILLLYLIRVDFTNITAQVGTALLASSLAHQIILFFGVSAAFFRYGHWMFLASLLSAVLLITAPRRAEISTETRD